MNNKMVDHLEQRVVAGLRRLDYPFLAELPSLEYILVPGKLRYQLLDWLFRQYEGLPETPAIKYVDGISSEQQPVDRLVYCASLVGITFDPTCEGPLPAGDDAERQKRLQLFEELIELAELNDHTDTNQVLERDVKLAHGIAAASKEIFSPILHLLPEDMQFPLAEDKPDWEAVERECMEKEALIGELQVQLKTLINNHPQSEERITKDELAGLQRELLVLKESSDRFYASYSAEFKSLIVQFNNSADMVALERNSKHMSERWTSAREKHDSVSRMLTDLSRISECASGATDLQLKEDNNHTHLREERYRHLRDELIVLGQQT